MKSMYNQTDLQHNFCYFICTIANRAIIIIGLSFSISIHQCEYIVYTFVIKMATQPALSAIYLDKILHFVGLSWPIVWFEIGKGVGKRTEEGDSWKVPLTPNPSTSPPTCQLCSILPNAKVFPGLGYDPDLFRAAGALISCFSRGTFDADKLMLIK